MGLEEDLGFGWAYGKERMADGRLAVRLSFVVCVEFCCFLRCSLHEEKR